MAAARADDGYDVGQRRRTSSSGAIDELVEGWGTGKAIDNVAPSQAGDARACAPGWRAWSACRPAPGRCAPCCARSPTHDAREDLEHLRVPTLILHRTGDRLIDVRHSRYMAEHIPGARLRRAARASTTSSASATPPALLGEMEEFLTGGRRALDRAPAADGPVHRHRRLHRPRRAPGRRALAPPARRPRRRGAPRARPLRRPRGQDDRRRGAGHVRRAAVERAALRAAPSSTRCTSLGLELRVGLHTGECEVIGDDVGGMAVHIAARVARTGRAGADPRLGDRLRDGHRRRPASSRTAACRSCAASTAAGRSSRCEG